MITYCGSIYGMYPKKAGETLNISKEEGKIVIDTTKNELPLTFKMVEEASAFAKAYGFIILNSRTNSRAWFPNLIKQLKGEITKETHFMEISAELSDARNIRIQGTQADFVKEASVVLNKYYKKNRIPSKILSWVHDEFVIKHHIDYIADNPKAKLKHPFVKGNWLNGIENVTTLILEEVANRYLVNVKIKVESSVAPNWLK